MPDLYEGKPMLIPEKFDKRRKLSEEDKKEIVENTMENKTNQEKRMEALSLAGVGNYYSLNVNDDIPKGSVVHVMIEQENGVEEVAGSSSCVQGKNNHVAYLNHLGNYMGNHNPSMSSQNNYSGLIGLSGVDKSKLDSVEQDIINSGYLFNRFESRRWITAQYMRLMNNPNGWDAAMNKTYDYKYTYEMMLEEIRVLVKLEKKKDKEFAVRSRFFTKSVVVAFVDHHLSLVKKEVNAAKRKKYKEEPYINIYGKNVYVKDIQEVIFSPIENAIKTIRDAKGYSKLYDYLKVFPLARVKYNSAKCKQWKEAFKGIGAYYTLDNLIKFHDIQIPFMKDGVIVNDVERNIEDLQGLLEIFEGEYWRFNILLKQVLAQNPGFDFNKSVKESKNRRITVK